LGRAHPDTATSLNSLAVLYDAMGKYKVAEPLYREALEIRKKLFGPNHIDTGTTLNNLAGLYQNIGDYAKADALVFCHVSAGSVKSVSARGGASNS
jgi:tetratricopeptide (TPR) repeat protein